MRVCVYGAPKVMSEEMMKAAENLGKWIADKGFSLTYGGFGDGLLGQVAVGARNAKEILGVFPTVPRAGHTASPYCTKSLYSDDKKERKRMQMENADMFIVLPEGMAVLDELFEILMLKQAGKFAKEIFVWNLFGTYDSLYQLLKDHNGDKLCHFINELEELDSYIA